MKTGFNQYKRTGEIMRTRLLTFWLLAICTPAIAQTHVLFDIGAPYFNASPKTNRTVTLQAMTPFPGNLVSYTTDTNGQFYFSNAFIGDYDGVIRQKGAAQEIKFQITVTATNLGTTNAYGLTSVRGVQTYPTAGRSAWSIQASDARYQPIGSSSTSLWTESGSTIYPSGSSGTSGGWTSTTTAIYPE